MSDEESLVIPDTLLVQLADGEIVEIPLEEYLKGVVPTEMGLQKPFEALKAQAIAARSYAVTARRHAIEGFDVCSTTHCQVYKPRNRYADADRAVDETAGRITSHQGKIVGTPFFAHCDGKTRNSEDVWAGKVAYLRSVPCICGYTDLYGHGVGMCQRGAAAMAQEGRTAEEILQHYYTGVKIDYGVSIPRTSFRRSIIMGQVLDGQRNPVAGVALVLTGPTGPVRRRTNEEGKFWISGLPAGEWELSFREKPLRRGNLITDGRNSLELEFVLSDFPALKACTMPLAYPRQLAGTLGYAGVLVTITDPEGTAHKIRSGSAEEYDPGGFAIPSTGAGPYSIQVFDQSFDLEVGDGGLWVQFEPRGEELSVP
jgi:hypothetical protein